VTRLSPYDCQRDGERWLHSGDKARNMGPAWLFFFGYPVGRGTGTGLV